MIIIFKADEVDYSSYLEKGFRSADILQFRIQMAVPRHDVQLLSFF